MILGVFCVVKIILIIRDIYREKKEKREQGAAPRWRRWGEVIVP